MNLTECSILQILQIGIQIGILKNSNVYLKEE